MNWDCIVVGTGPAGATALETMAKSGLRVLGLEKKRLPRYKSCGGALSRLSTQQLDFDLSGVIEDRIHKISVGYLDTKPVLYDSDDPVALLVMRDRFDQLLVGRAEDAGATVVDGRKTLSIRSFEDHVAVETDGGTHRAQAVIGADGASSLVAKSSGLLRHVRWGLGLEVEIPCEPEVMAGWKSRAAVRYGRPTFGYGWIFPKANHLSAGVGTMDPRATKELKTDLDEFIRAMGLSGVWESKRSGIRVKGHPIPQGGVRRRICTQRVLLAGDAAGLADPLSGEGIAHAITSGRLAAESVLEAHSTGDFGFESYGGRVWDQIGAELAMARWIAKKFYMFPGVFFRVFMNNERLVAHYFDLVKGKKRYSDIAEALRKEFRRGGLFKKMQDSPSSAEPAGH